MLFCIHDPRDFSYFTRVRASGLFFVVDLLTKWYSFSQEGEKKMKEAQDEAERKEQEQKKPEEPEEPEDEEEEEDEEAASKSEEPGEVSPSTSSPLIAGNCSLKNIANPLNFSRNRKKLIYRSINHPLPK